MKNADVEILIRKNADVEILNWKNADVEILNWKIFQHLNFNMGKCRIEKCWLKNLLMQKFTFWTFQHKKFYHKFSIQNFSNQASNFQQTIQNSKLTQNPQRTLSHSPAKQAECSGRNDAKSMHTKCTLSLQYRSK